MPSSVEKISSKRSRVKKSTWYHSWRVITTRKKSKLKDNVLSNLWTSQTRRFDDEDDDISTIQSIHLYIMNNIRILLQQQYYQQRYIRNHDSIFLGISDRQAWFEDQFPSRYVRYCAIVLKRTICLLQLFSATWTYVNTLIYVKIRNKTLEVSILFCFITSYNALSNR